MTDKFKPIQNVPKTYEQFILEDQQLTSEQKQNLYPDLVHEDIGSNKGYGPCNRSDCSCSPEELRRQARELNELADERTPFVSFTVEVVNSSGSGWNSGGRCHVDLNSKSEARTFISQVRGSWVSSGGYWSSCSSSGIGSISAYKRGNIARAVERRLSGDSSGNIWDSEVR